MRLTLFPAALFLFLLPLARGQQTSMPDMPGMDMSSPKQAPAKPMQMPGMDMSDPMRTRATVRA